MTVEKILTLLPEHDIRVRSDGQEATISLYVNQHPYRNDNMDFVWLDFSNHRISFLEQYRILFQTMIEKAFNGKDEYERLSRCYSKIVKISTCFKPSDIELLNGILVKINASKEFEGIMADYILLCKQLKYPYKESTSLKLLVDKIIKLIASEYTKSLISSQRIVFTFDIFEWLYTESTKELASVFQKMKISVLGFLYGKQITEKIKSCIEPKYLYCSDLNLALNIGEENSVVISLENNPWRNGVMNGDKLFAKINADGETKYIVFNLSAEGLLREQSISLKTDLNVFMDHLAKLSQDFTSLMNAIFLKAISFSEFGCCSKYAECERQGMCLHTDQLYATACQWQKHLKRSGKYDGIKEKQTG